MKNNFEKEMLRNLAKQNEEYEEIAKYPLSQYSTTQLKAELRRRKKEGGRR